MLSFTYPFFLWGLLALAAPLLLHLLNRKRSRRHVFPSIRFLQISQLPREGRKQLRDWILLLCRMIIFACLVITMARPHWRPKPKVTPSNDLKQAFFLLDASASMQTDGSLEQGKQLVKDALEKLSGWQYGGAVYAMQTLAIAPFQNDLEPLHALIEDWKPGYTVSNPEDALAAAISAFSAEAGRKKLYVISDFQRSDWNLKKIHLPEDISLELLPTMRETSDNCSVFEVTVMPLGNQQQRILVNCRNYSAVPQQRLLTVRLGTETQTREITLPPMQTQRIAFVFQSLDGQGSQGSATLSRDSFARDDYFCFWAGNPQPVNVLLVLPDEPSENSDMAAFFTQKALEAEQDGIPGLFRVQRLGAGALFAADLDSCQTIFLLGASERLSSNDLQRLKDFMLAGGSIFHCPGPAPNLSWHALQGQGFCDIAFNGMVGEASRHSALGLGWLAPDSMLQDIFPPENSSDLFLFNIRKHARLQPGSQEKVLLRTLAGLPVLLEREHGKGHFYSFAFAFDLSWSDFPLSQSFLPLLRELCAALIPADHGRKKITCGEPLPKITRLDGSEILPEKAVDTTQPGLARIGEYLIEINLNPAESSPDTVKTGDLLRLLQSGSTTAGMPLLPPSTDSRPLWKFWALAMAVFILIEALLCQHADRKA
jgi:hypothetical protein